MMVQLQSILVPTDDVCSVKELYYHKTSENRVDFDGYFNLFYIEKRKAYTNMESLFLDIQVQGYDTLILVHDGEDLEQISLDKDCEKAYRIRFPYERFETGAFWFALTGGNVATLTVCGGFTAELPETKARKVNIGIDICTYKRETYVVRNLKQLKSQILDSDLQVSNHVQIFVIDNGKTLAVNEPVQNIVERSGKRIHIIPNMNAGGAGGFTRGMLEILDRKEQEEFTHVLLMDDDAVVEPDALVRIYGFLSTVKEEWKDMTVGGAMLREDYPHMLYCAGEWWEAGKIVNPVMNMDLTVLENAKSDYLCSAAEERKRYSGWWCCCYSLNTVRKDNLPIPLFLHQDDIEFGLRNCDNGIVFLNGVGVWHRGPELSFPGTNIYYDLRNNLIEIALHQEDRKKTTARKIIIRAMVVALVRMKYKDAEFVYQAVQDFLRGPLWLHSQNPEKLHAEIRSKAYQMKALEALKEELSEEEYNHVVKQIEHRRQVFGLKEIIEKSALTEKVSVLKVCSFNGWLLPASNKMVEVLLPVDSLFRNFRKKKVVLYEPVSNKTVLIEKNYKQFMKSIVLLVKTLCNFENKFEHAQSEYNNKISEIVNENSWKEYLELK